MMMGEFNQADKVEFYAVAARKPDLSRLQAAMFIDRPDLWRKPAPKRRRRVPDGQLQMFTDPEHIYLGLPPQCKIEKERPENDHDTN